MRYLETSRKRVWSFKHEPDFTRKHNVVTAMRGWAGEGQKYTCSGPPSAVCQEEVHGCEHQGTVARLQTALCEGPDLLGYVSVTHRRDSDLKSSARLPFHRKIKLSNFAPPPSPHQNRYCLNEVTIILRAELFYPLHALQIQNKHRLNEKCKSKFIALYCTVYFKIRTL